MLYHKQNNRPGKPIACFMQAIGAMLGFLKLRREIYIMINFVTASNTVGFSTASTGVNTVITINNFPPHTPSAGLSPYTDEEIVEQLKELAKRDVAEGNIAWSSTSAMEPGSPNYEEFRRLMTYFQSNVAPDRVGTVNRQLSTLSRGINISTMRNSQNMNIFDILMRSLGRSGRNSNIGINFIHFTDGCHRGLPIATYSQGSGLTVGFREGDGDLQRAGEFRLMFIDIKTEIFSKEGNTDALIELKKNEYHVDLSLWSGKGQAFNMERLAANGIIFNPKTEQTNLNQTKLQQVTNRYEAFTMPQ